ncbi:MULTISPECIES: CcoQ/FixQ family Cbb3-type cytochrome c oxidase assembly chaperone [Idiomarina]|jgi:cytochrome c oxidase cbb3-type subunit 4|uniref:CcoQ/FixQ family Cbb3-type cytochrome c oxidase assembly chaperone n=1 Tax=Idiomarina abyssalis TaxID=86102 RepID=A0A8I1GC08_9GAMM|nr:MULTISPECIES: CcoQ/FixQ family Cbb3-type cytochrome c oxidase assembly chaperone [Idiomarina]KPD22623.1 cytochrome C oxidase [Idiomarina abyssalis]MAB21634.1 CcoQ/FixQ family Cbb3-type cytochrome c oxidase assembly chaperone [Idiomarina sp.]MAL83059.1 CcoQ/FixQ family Cbb3-type cytochrome c oxidase assembly chaperone [Idiomarina sp.]MAO67213.1 CcoQ/FixQ family Cbb3-type cytochrome c oxidase assembly chaperone [Idiomarina sp.]MBE92604.1 CcoQ/FixQ family Cbb3-type cytochrome c oxidase assembl|tara:strand:+ start:660 stop:842 length:183 start_codon:yes stop_codon:yes gene_type:complete
MDYGTWRGVFSLIILAIFIAIVFWAFSRRTKKQFDEAANSIFEDESSVDKSDKPESKKDE